MPRRSWRDLATDRPDGTAPSGTVPSPAADMQLDPGLLHRAAAGDTRLAGLLAERAELESQLAGLTGPPRQDADPRFPVTGLQERRAEIASWAGARDAARTSRSRPPTGGRIPRTGLGRVADGGAARGPRSQLLAPLRSGLGGYDRVRSALERTDEMLEGPRQLADGLTERWEERKEEITGPLDRVGRYAEARDRVLDLDTGGSGDLFERAETARRRALERHAEQAREVRRIAALDERRHHRSAAERRDAERLDRRTATGRGVRS